MNKKKVYRYLISGLLLLVGMLVLAFLLVSLLSAVVWKMDGNPGLVSGGIIAIYIIVAGSGGFITGNIFGKQKFFWGFLCGFLFFSIVLLAGVLFTGARIEGNGRIFPGFMICSVAGMAGGMLSPGRKDGK